MIKKVRIHFKEHWRAYVDAAADILLIGGLCYFTYRIGCQRGVNVVQRTLEKHDPDLYKQVDDLYQSLYS